MINDDADGQGADWLKDSCVCNFVGTPKPRGVRQKLGFAPTAMHTCYVTVKVHTDVTLLKTNKSENFDLSSKISFW
jgi:hypothetical protein